MQTLSSDADLQLATIRLAMPTDASVATLTCTHGHPQAAAEAVEAAGESLSEVAPLRDSLSCVPAPAPLQQLALGGVQDAGSFQGVNGSANGSFAIDGRGAEAGDAAGRRQSPLAGFSEPVVVSVRGMVSMLPY